MFYFWNTETVHWICPIFTELLINVVLIPRVQMGKSFRYLGRFFDFNVSNNQHMSELSSLVQELMNDIDIKTLHPKHKLLLYSRYVHSKFSWHFTIANISKTWITEHLHPVVNGYIRKWPDSPISGTLSNVFLERNKFSLNICPPSIKFNQCHANSSPKFIKRVTKWFLKRSLEIVKPSH